MGKANNISCNTFFIKDGIHDNYTNIAKYKEIKNKTNKIFEKSQSYLKHNHSIDSKNNYGYQFRKIYGQREYINMVYLMLQIR